MAITKILVLTTILNCIATITVNSISVHSKRETRSSSESAPCPDENFVCKNGECIPLKWKCDGTEDCADKSDEINCQNMTKFNACGVNEFKCENSSRCIPKRWKCDGTDDCGDNSDERNCTTKTCSSLEFQCEFTKECIPKRAHCDGKTDCSDGTDEDICKPCEEGEFKCYRKCIPTTKVCDGKKDCSKGEDESTRCGVNECALDNGRCDQTCIDLPIGYQCACVEGFRLTENQKSCEYVNVCNTFGTCHQLCHESNGNYTCACADGYTLQSDGKRCIADGERFSIFFTNRIDIRKMSVKTTTEKSKYDLVVKGLKNVISIDLHIKKRYVYWSDVINDNIARMQLDNPNSKEVIIKNVAKVWCIAVDWINEKIYWISGYLRAIMVAELDGKNIATVVSTGRKEPLSISVDPYSGHIYWTEMGYTSGTISRLSMDGNIRSKKVLLSENIFWPNGFTLDLIQRKMYWIDGKSKHFEVANMENGKNRILLKRRNLGMSYGLDNFEENLYWTDVEVQSINSMIKYNTSSNDVIKGELFAPMGLKVYHPSKQMPGHNVCGVNNNNCSHLCLPTNNNGQIKAVCKCPDKMKFAAGSKSKCVQKTMSGKD